VGEKTKLSPPLPASPNQQFINTQQVIRRRRMLEVKNYQELEAWNQAMDLVIACYQLTSKLPEAEIYGLSNQIQKAAVSIPSNIAEGQGRQHSGEYIYLHHLSLANGSLKELETQLLIAERLSYLENTELQSILQLSDRLGSEIEIMLNSLKEKVKEQKEIAEARS
jgi:four helix bundle protein